MTTLTVDREQVMAYRIAAQGLHRTTDDPTKLAVLDLGIQQANSDPVRLALASRLGVPEAADVMGRDDFTLGWTVRGAPHLHRTADLPTLAARLWPVNERDATSRLAAERKPLGEAGVAALEAFTTAAAAMRKVVQRTMTKGEVSTEVTAALPPAYSYECRRCRAVHVYGGLFQLVGLFAGVRLVPEAATTSLAPWAKRPPVPKRSARPTELLRAYVRLHGPATLTDAAAYFGTAATAVRSAWPDDLVEVRVGRRKAWITPESVDELRRPARPPKLRLLPPYDPFVQARDRDLLVPERERQKAVWRILGNPGTVLADGEVIGTWRSKLSGRRHLELTVQPFETITPRLRKVIDEEAARIATVRGASDFTVTMTA